MPIMGTMCPISSHHVPRFWHTPTHKLYLVNFRYNVRRGIFSSRAAAALFPTCPVQHLIEILSFITHQCLVQWQERGFTHICLSVQMGYRIRGIQRAGFINLCYWRGRYGKVRGFKTEMFGFDRCAFAYNHGTFDDVYQFTYIPPGRDMSPKPPRLQESMVELARPFESQTDSSRTRQ